jgi:hypothetical protein
MFSVGFYLLLRESQFIDRLYYGTQLRFLFFQYLHAQSLQDESYIVQDHSIMWCYPTSLETFEILKTLKCVQI